MNIRKIVSSIIPNKKLSKIVLLIATLGIVSGSIFLVIINQNDKTTVVNSITSFINNISNNNISNVQALKNSIINNYTYIILIFLLGLSLIGILLNIFLTYIKGFVIGFTISSFIYVYGLKGIIACLIYIVPFMINLLLIIVLTAYTIILSKYLYTLLLGNRFTNFKLFLKKYLTIFLIFSIITIFTCLYESFLIPALFKLVIKLFV